MGVSLRLNALAGRYRLDAVYAFGSRATDVAAFVRDGRALDPTADADVDVGVLPGPGHVLDLHARVRLAGDLEDLFGISRVDLVVLPQAPPYLALDVVSGELLVCADPVREAKHQLFVLRRAGDLAYFERERRHQLLARPRP